jgi:hypothetical protein
MSDIDLHVEIDGDIIVVTDPATRYYALYTKPSERIKVLPNGHGPHLTLLRRRPTKDHSTIASGYQAAVSKARELGWIV